MDPVICTYCHTAITTTGTAFKGYPVHVQCWHELVENYQLHLSIHEKLDTILITVIIATMMFLGLLIVSTALNTL